ncbi:MAG: flavin reductase family protein, partial [Alphaproteobacteria bacterium]|nr:flavin reductase family protein [Alphaproteobacteria bacterium]
MTHLHSEQTAEALFKTGMQLLASTVTLITSMVDGRRAGMAATAVSSLTADPPSLLICTNRTSR